MGKRRTDLSHHQRSANDDDDDDDVIEEVEQTPEPLTQDQVDSIKARKKLVPKRKTNMTSSYIDSPFSLNSKQPVTADLTSDENKPAQQSLFAGFKGFSSFKPLITSSTVNNSTTKSFPSIDFDKSTKSLSVASSLTNGTAEKQPGFISTLNDFSAAKKATTTFSRSNNNIVNTNNSLTFNNNNSTEHSNQSNGLHKIPNDENNINSKSINSSQQSNGPATTNVDEAELKFINGLHDLFEQCYGTSRRINKLPEDALNSDDGSDFDYADMLSDLNKQCSEWIRKHVEDNQWVILTPVFIDYLNYLTLLEKHFFPATLQKSTTKTTASTESSTLTKIPNGNSTSADNKSTPTSFFSLVNNVKPTQTADEYSLNKILNGGGDRNEKSDIQEIAPSFGSNDSQTPKINFFSSINKEKSAESETQKNVNGDLNETKENGVRISSQESEKSTTASVTAKEFFSMLAKEKTPPKDESKLNEKSIENGSGETSSAAPISFFSLTNKEKASFSAPVVTTPTLATATFFNKPSNDEVNSATMTEVKKVTDSSQQSIFKNFAFAATSSTSIFSFNQNSNSANSNPPTVNLTGSSMPAFSTGSGAGSSSNSATLTPFSTFQFGSGVAAKAGLFGSGGSLFGNNISSLSGNSNTPNQESVEADEEEYQPPKPESSDVKEDGAVFTKRIKLFYFNDKEKKFSDRGIGNLFIKPLKESDNYQLIVRADNKLASILLNVKLNKVFPIEREGTNNVSYACFPNPPIQNVDSSVPCKFLFKVKGENDAKELFDKLNEYKK